MKPIVFLLAFSLNAIASTAAQSSNPFLFEIRSVLNNPTTDSVKMTVIRKDRAGDTIREALNVSKRVLMDISDLESATFQKSPISNRPQIGITFTDHGRKTFADVSRTNINKQIAILFDGKVVSTPVIRQEITGGKAVIDGNFTEEEAKDLADRINKAVQENPKGKAKPWTHGPYDKRVTVPSRIP